MELKSEKETATTRSTTGAVNACLLLISLAGGSMLAWWSMAFHGHNEQLWMVPLGLVMMGTPLVAWFVVFASDTWEKLELLLAEKDYHDRPSPQHPPPDLEK